MHAANLVETKRMIHVVQSVVNNHTFTYLFGWRVSFMPITDPIGMTYPLNNIVLLQYTP